MRDLNGCCDPSKWGDRAQISKEDVLGLTDPTTLYYPAIAFWYFVQYHLHLQVTVTNAFFHVVPHGLHQLLEATSYARKHGVVIKGDLPIGVARFSVDAWVNPHLFNLDKQTGAPPDFFGNCLAIMNGSQLTRPLQLKMDRTGASLRTTGKLWLVTATNGGTSACTKCQHTFRCAA